MASLMILHRCSTIYSRLPLFLSPPLSLSYTIPKQYTRNENVPHTIFSLSISYLMFASLNISVLHNIPPFSNISLWLHLSVYIPPPPFFGLKCRVLEVDVRWVFKRCKRFISQAPYRWVVLEKRWCSDDDHLLVSCGVCRGRLRLVSLRLRDNRTQLWVRALTLDNIAQCLWPQQWWMNTTIIG